MKRILIGFLVFTCLLFSASAYLRLFQAAYGNIPDDGYSTGGQTDKLTAKNSFEIKLTKQVKHFKRYFHAGNGHFVLSVEKVIRAWNCLGLLACFMFLFFLVHFFSLSLRSPPAKLRF